MMLSGCGGGSSGNGSPSVAQPVPSLVIQPKSFDFGLVTEGNLDELPARQISVRNTGTVSYNVSSIRLEGANPSGFLLDTSGGASACGATVRSLSPGASCTLNVRFTPRAFGEYGANLVVQSNDPVAPIVSSVLRGTFVEVQDLKVTVNQVDACPRQIGSTAFVSVTDQVGFPIKNLGLSDFSLEEMSQGVPLDSVETVGASDARISISIVMDYSSSITRFPERLENVDAAARILVENLKEGDEADIVKYADEVRFMLPDFTSDKSALLAAIAEDPGLVSGSAFYEATLAAIDRLKDRTKRRKAIIVLTDGADTSISADLNDVINTALLEDIPVFSVGIGNVNSLELTKIASDTGGIYYETLSLDNLSATYQQLANLLFDDQYVLSYLSGLPDDQSALLEVTVNFIRDGRGFEGAGSGPVPACLAP